MDEKEKLETEIDEEIEEIEEALEEAEEKESEAMPKWAKQILENQTTIMSSLNQNQTAPKQEVQEIAIPMPQEQEAEVLEQEQEQEQEQEAEVLEEEAPKESKLSRIAKFLF